MARKGLGNFLGITREIYKSSTTTAFQPRLATDDSH